MGNNHNIQIGAGRVRINGKDYLDEQAKGRNNTIEIDGNTVMVNGVEHVIDGQDDDGGTVQYGTFHIGG